MRRPLLCYITDRSQFCGDEAARRARLLAKIGEAAHAGIDYIQLREKDLTARELENLGREALRLLQEAKSSEQNRQPRTDHHGLRTALLINSRTDVALAVGADGIHLPAGGMSPVEVRRIWSCSAGAPARVTISVACHNPEDVHQAQNVGADLAVFAPVFEKQTVPETKPAGLDALRAACQYKIPVLALGGITLNNAAACLEAGAAGIAAIRLFQENDVPDIIGKLRNL